MKNCYFVDLNGKIITPEDYSYEDARQEWNRSIQKYPVALIYCESNEDVSKAILWAQSKEVPIRVRSGGHNYEGYSTGNGVVVIDVSKMNKIIVDELRNQIKLQAGARNKSIYEALGKYGYPFPGGTCPTVGVSGYTLGAGWNLSARKMGLGCDSLQEIGIIDYKGCLLKASKYENEDLFWALKGGGSENFGIVVYLVFNLPQKVDLVTYFYLYYPNVSESNQKKFLKTWQEWLPTASNEMTLQGGLYNTEEDGKYAFLRGISYKNTAETKELLKPFYEIEGLEDHFEEASFYDTMMKLQVGYPEYGYFKSSARFVDRMLSTAEINSVVNIINSERPEGSNLTQISLYALGGKVKDIPPKGTAFYFRNAYYMLGMQTEFESNKYKEINYNWFDGKFNTIINATKGSFINFPYNKLSNPGYNYYGENISRLRLIKSKYDPYDVFNYPQGLYS